MLDQLGPRPQIQYRACAVGILGWSIIDMSEVDNTYWSIIGGVRYRLTQNLLPGSKKLPKPSYGQKIVHGSSVPQFIIFQETERFIRTYYRLHITSNVCVRVHERSRVRVRVPHNARGA